MPRPQTRDSNLQQSLVPWLLGFFGFTAAFLFLPKTLKFLIRRFFFGLFGEIVAVVLSGLLTEKAVEWLTEEGLQRNGAERRAVPRRP